MRVKTTVRRILIVSAHFPPCATMSIHRMIAFVHHLQALGWTVTVLAIRNIHEGKPIDLDLIKKVPCGVEVMRAPYLDPFKYWARLKTAFIPKSNAQQATSVKVNSSEIVNIPSVRVKETISTLLQTPDNYVGWIPFGAFKALSSMKSHDVILASGPPFSSLLLGVVLKTFWKAKLVVDLRDPWSGNCYRSNLQGIAGKLDRYLENLVFGSADVVIANTDSSAQLYAGQHPECSSRLITITNGFDSTHEEVLTIRDLPSSTLSIVHVGTLYGLRSISPLINVIKSFQKEDYLEDLKIDLFGSIESDHKELFQVRGNIIEFHGRVTHSEAIARIKGSDIVLVVGNCVPDSVQIPGKIFELMPLRKPIWLIDEPPSPSAKLLKESGLPFFFSKNNERDIAMTLREIIGFHTRYPLKQLVSPPTEKIEQFSRKNLVYRLHQHLMNLL